MARTYDPIKLDHDSTLQHWDNLGSTSTRQNGIHLVDNLSNLKCAFCKHYLLKEPRQMECGDRVCSDCHSSFIKGKNNIQTCPMCGSEVAVDNSFRDKAVEHELAKTTVKCNNPGCSWLGEAKYITQHYKECRYAVLRCPNAGCKRSIQRGSMDEHLAACPYTPTLCEWCGEKITQEGREVHIETECEDFSVMCSNGCGELLKRKELPDHLQNGCQLKVSDCEYKNVGCEFRGNSEKLAIHDAQYAIQHLKMVNRDLRRSNATLRGHQQPQASHAVVSTANGFDERILSLGKEISQIKAEIAEKLQPGVDAMTKMESTVQQLQEGFGEMALMVQTLQATSYSGTFIWKIPEVRRRKNEAKAGKTISLYSAPFYTSRHGYKLCLRLYMDGDGSGKGTHLSFFLTIMRGEYDALLPWPFRQTVTLMLLDQDKEHDIVQSFRPEPSSSSFQRPRTEMNVASGCPTFARLSVLNNNSYVKDDTMFFKCVIDTSGLEPS